MPSGDELAFGRSHSAAILHLKAAVGTDEIAQYIEAENL